MNCTYNGKNKLKKRVKKLVDRGLALPVCPEVLGGSPVPRVTCEISGGDGNDVLDGTAKVVTPSGRDISGKLILGARKTLGLARRYKIRKTILKSKSPSCGYGKIYDGSFRRVLKKGDGVTAVLLSRNKIKIYSEKDSRYG